jgi:hypothetical protein
LFKSKFSGHDFPVHLEILIHPQIMENKVRIPVTMLLSCFDDGTAA